MMTNKTNQPDNVSKETEKEERERLLDRMTDDFYKGFCSYGSRDVYAAMEILIDFDKSEDDILEAIDEYVKDCGTDRNDLDITALAYEMILQEVRNKISEVIDFDIMNDAGFYVAGNYMCTSFDHSEEDTEALITAIKEAEPETRIELLEDNDILTWLEMVDIDINQFKICSNCEQWIDKNGDCLNECHKKNLA